MILFRLELQMSFLQVHDVLSIEAAMLISIIHKLSHQHLYIKFWKVKLTGAIAEGVSSAQLKDVSVSYCDS